MLKFLSLFLSLGSLTFAEGAPTNPPIQSISDDPYHLTISKLSQQEKQCFIQLSNGSIWNAPFPEILEGKGAWQVGDKIEIGFPKNLVLLNLDKLTVCPVHYSYENKNGDLVYVAGIEKKGGRCLLLTNDGSLWNVGWWSHLWLTDWKVGDHLIISSQHPILGHSTHTMINVESEFKSANVQLLSKGGVPFLPSEAPEKTSAYQTKLSELTFDSLAAYCTLNDGSRWKIKSSKTPQWIKGQCLSAGNVGNKIYFENEEANRSLKVENVTPPSQPVKIDRLDPLRKILFTSDGSIWVIKKEKVISTSIGPGDCLTIMPETNSFNKTRYLIFNHTQKMLFEAFLLKYGPHNL